MKNLKSQECNQVCSICTRMARCQWRVTGPSERWSALQIQELTRSEI